MQRPVWLPEDIRLKVSPRRKNFGIKLNLDGSCELLAPPHVSEAALERAFRSFEPWLKKKREQLSLKRQALPIHSFSFAVGSEFFFLGQQYPLLPDSCGISRRIRFNGSALLTPETDPQKIRSLLEDFYRNQAKRLLAIQLQKACTRCGCNYRKLTVNGAKKRFGSCNSRGDLNFSWRLMMYPPELIELVICHELAHRTEMNHSPRFYQVLATYLPDHRQRDAQLRQWTQLLAGYPA